MEKGASGGHFTKEKDVHFFALPCPPKKLLSLFQTAKTSSLSFHFHTREVPWIPRWEMRRKGIKISID